MFCLYLTLEKYLSIIIHVLYGFVSFGFATDGFQLLLARVNALVVDLELKHFIVTIYNFILNFALKLIRFLSHLSFVRVLVFDNILLINIKRQHLLFTI